MAYPEIQATGVSGQGTPLNEEPPSPKISDHYSENLKRATNECRRRVGCDLREGKYNRVLGELVYTQQKNPAKIHTVIVGPPGTPYDGSDAAAGTAPNQQLPLPSCWFLVSSERTGPTGKWRRQVGRGIHKAEFYCVNRVFSSAEDNKTTKIHAPIFEPPGTPYQGNGSARRRASNHQLPLPNLWCRVSSGHEGPTDEYRRCVGYSNTEVQFYRVHKVSFSAKENTAKTSGLVIGPTDTPYEAGASPRANTPKKQLRSAYFWGLVSYEREESTNDHRCRSRCGVLKAEFYLVARVPVPAEENDAAKIHALIIMGPPGTPHEGGFFHFLIKCPPDNPDRSPIQRLMTTGAGRVRFGPTFYQNVTACQGHLGSLYEATWISYWYLLNGTFLSKFLLTPEMPVSKGSDFTVLLALGMWLSDKTRYSAVQPHETTFGAVWDAVKESLRTTTACPRYHWYEIGKHFPQIYEEYWWAVKGRLHFPDSSKQDSTEKDASLYQFGTILGCLVSPCEAFNLLSKTAVG